MNYEAERKLIEEVAQHAGLVGEDQRHFTTEVVNRLEKGEIEYGPDAYLDLEFDEIMAESTEEGADINGWDGLALRRLEHQVENGRLTREQANLIRWHVIEGAARAYVSWAEHRIAAELYREFILPRGAFRDEPLIPGNVGGSELPE
jgi:hypothetical protein